MEEGWAKVDSTTTTGYGFVSVEIENEIWGKNRFGFVMTIEMEIEGNARALVKVYRN